MPPFLFLLKKVCRIKYSAVVLPYPKYHFMKNLIFSLKLFVAGFVWLYFCFWLAS
jgi:hypothetical protein